jgi:3',5'-cyclic AMP phosphodiesterase CpdA
LIYPYLGDTTATSVVISWAARDAGTGEVRYSLDQAYRYVVTSVDSTYDGKYWHSATVTGLTADTTYYYKIYTSGYDVTPWSEVTFTTAPETTASSFTFVALGDGRPDTASSLPSQGALDVAAEIEHHSFDLALHTGDIVNSGGICSGDDSSWNQYIRAYFDLYRESLGDIPFYLSVGNHELNGGSCGYQAYTDVYHLPENGPSGNREEYYSFDWGNAHFVALDTNQVYSADSTQYNWLVNDLQTSAQPWKFVFFHHPPYSSGPNGSTGEVQNYLVPVFETYDVDVVFSGHDHHYERTCPISNGACTTVQDGGVIYYVTGGAGAPLYTASGDWFTAYSDSLNHFLKVECNDCLLHVDAIDVNGNVFDAYEIDRCGISTSTRTGVPLVSMRSITASVLRRYQYRLAQ